MRKNRYSADSLRKIGHIGLSLSLALLCKTGYAQKEMPIMVEPGIAAFEQGNFERALALLEPLATKGDAKAMYLLGTMYEDGLGIPYDDVKAELLYRKAAALGCSKSQLSIGMMYLGDENDTAEYWLERALSNNHPNAQYVLQALHNGEYDDFC